jgi:long-subunit acyl-CoA synthetase (AMP-forming)
LNQWTEKSWKALSNRDFRATSEELARGLLALGLEKGDHHRLLRRKSPLLL